MAGTAIIAAVAVFIGVIYLGVGRLRTYRARSKMIKDHGCMPVPKVHLKEPLFGLDYFMANKKAFDEHRLVESYEADFERYGSTYGVNQFGTTILATRDPEHYKTVMSKDFESWGVAPVRYKASVPFLGESFFIIDEGWKHGRSKTRPVLAKNEYGDLVRFETHFEKFLALLPRDESTVDLKPYLDRLLQSFSSEYFLGERIDTLRPDISTESVAIMESLEIALAELVQGMFMGKLINFIPTSKRYLKAAAIVRRFVNKNVDRVLSRSYDEKAEKGNNGHRVFLEDLAQETSDKVVLSDAALTMYTAGADTTATTVSAVFWAISRHPEVVQKMREEVLSVCGDDKPNLEALNKMKYNRAVLNESMRLYGITSGFNFRSALKDTVLPHGGGPNGTAPIFVEKGTTLVMPFRALHTNPERWGPDAKEFKPERFLNPIHDFWDFQAFGGGPRNCPGQNMAITNASYITARMLQEFKAVESRDSRPWTEYLKLTTENLYGCQVGLVPVDA